MEEIKFKSMEKAARDELRRLYVKLKKQGKKKKEIAQLLGVRPATISSWEKIVQSQGIKGLSESRRGRKQGEKRTLTEEQEKQIQQILVEKHPEQVKLPFVLWNRQAVGDLIRIQFKIKMPVRTVGDYLNRWGFTPQKPIKRAYEQQPQQIKEWLDNQYPAIKEEAKLEKGIILWCDETGVNSESYICRGYSPSGVKPVALTSGKRFSLSMVSAISNEGKVHYMVYQGAMNSKIFISYLGRVLQTYEMKVFMVLDNLRVHHSKLVEKYVSKRDKKIKLCFLPAYAPEYNPDEYLNQDIKLGISKKPKPRDKETLKKNVKSHMTKLQRNPEKCSRFFNHPKVQYAAYGN